MGQNICKRSNWQGINFQNKFMQLSSKVHATQLKKKKSKEKGRGSKHTFLQGRHERTRVCVCVGGCVSAPSQSCLTLYDPMDCSPPGSSVHGILQARVLEWGAISSSRSIFPIQDSNLGLLHWGQILYPPSYEGCLSHSVVSNSLRPRESQHTRPPCPSPTPGVYPNSCPLSRWCQPTVFNLCRLLLLLPSIFPSIRVFSNESAVCIRWPKYWSL